MAVENVSALLLQWYDRHARTLPWRIGPRSNLKPDPYAVWMSEIMLQQTTVAAVAPYFTAFQKRWPSVEALAAADDADVMAAWAGLGYYSRARNLLACARVIANDYGGVFPEDESILIKLPGIGAYTAAAIAAIAFGHAATVVDGNVERVVSRLFSVSEPLPGARKQLRTLAATLTPALRPGDYAQAMMDLGATICTPRQPQCLLCPLTAHCSAFSEGRAADFPVKAIKAPRPERYGRVFWIEHDDHVFLVRRPDKGLLGGMRALPTSDWIDTDSRDSTDSDVPPPPFEEAWQIADQRIRHIFTHFALTLDVAIIQLRTASKAALNLPGDGQWWPVETLEDAGLPTVFEKAATVAQATRSSASARYTEQAE